VSRRLQELSSVKLRGRLEVRQSQGEMVGYPSYAVRDGWRRSKDAAPQIRGAHSRAECASWSGVVDGIAVGGRSAPATSPMRPARLGDRLQTARVPDVTAGLATPVPVGIQRPADGDDAARSARGTRRHVGCTWCRSERRRHDVSILAFTSQ